MSSNPLNRSRKRYLLALGGLTPVVFFICLMVGPSLSWSELGAFLKGEASPGATMILWQIRLPRLIFAFLVGAGLSAAGATLQSLLQNPLAEPYTLGISGGAVFGVTLGIWAALPLAFLPLWGFAGALLAMALVYILTLRKDFSLYELILGGVVIGFIFSSLVVMILLFLPADVSQNSLLILVGNLSGVSTDLLPWVGVIIALGIAWLFTLAPQLNLLSLGDEKAKSLGVDPPRTIRTIFWITSAITGACVSASGLIGFLGLMIPHLFRLLIGADLIFLLPLSCLGGGLFLMVADTFARSLFYPQEIPVGVITGIAGGIFFLFMLFKKEKF